MSPPWFRVSAAQLAARNNAITVAIVGGKRAGVSRPFTTRNHVVAVTIERVEIAAAVARHSATTDCLDPVVIPYLAAPRVASIAPRLARCFARSGQAIVVLIIIVIKFVVIIIVVT